MTRKNSQSLGVGVENEEVVFEGSVEEAVRLYPKNVNVASVLGIAVGFERVKVRIIADPTISENVHTISVRGEFGELKIEVRNRPMPDNPKTSYLAALSAIKAVKSIRERVVIGT